MKSLQWITSISIALILSGCGGGGGSAGESGFNNDAPVTASDLSISSSALQLGNTDSSKVIVTVTALDSGKRAMKGAKVELSVSSGNVIIRPTGQTVDSKGLVTTNEQGVVTAEVVVGENKANRLASITAKSGSIAKTLSLQVVGVKIASTLSAPVVKPGAEGRITYRVVDQSANPMQEQEVKITAVGFNPSTKTGSTDANGEFVYVFQAPSVTDQYTISATIAGVRSDSLIKVESASLIPDAAIDIVSGSVSANPTVIGINPSGSQNRTQIRALFVGPNNAPVENVRVRIDLNGDPNRVGGVFSNGLTEIQGYSNQNGIFTTAYIPGTRSSPPEGVIVRLCYGKTDVSMANGACPNARYASLTVVDDPLGITIGTDNIVEVNSSKLTYIRKYVVQVVDSAGNPKADVNLSATVDLPWFLKGQYVKGTDSWVPDVTDFCWNEDLDRSGNLELSEDINANNRLDPGKSDVKISFIDKKTDADGLALLRIEYPQNYAGWVAADIKVSASGVLGTEGRHSYSEYPVPVVADAVKNKDVAPPFVRSPYGVLGDTNVNGTVVDGCRLKD